MTPNVPVLLHFGSFYNISINSLRRKKQAAVLDEQYVFNNVFVTEHIGILKQSLYDFSSNLQYTMPSLAWVMDLTLSRL